MIADPRIRGVAVTGSERAGSAVAAEAGKALKKSTMELGGSDAYIVLDDADMDKAVEWAVFGRMNNAGQCCVGAKRFILEEPIADEFVNRFKAALAKFMPGDPTDPKTTLAPLCTERALTLVESQIDSAVKGHRSAGWQTCRPAGLFPRADDSLERHVREPDVPSGVLCSRGNDLPREERRRGGQPRQRFALRAGRINHHQ